MSNRTTPPSSRLRRVRAQLFARNVDERRADLPPRVIFSLLLPSSGPAAATTGPQFSGDEYDQLLQYVDYEAERSKRGGGDDDDEDEELVEKRPWYAPWKKVKQPSTKAKKIPEEWLQTDHRQGLDESEVEKRRHDFGYNELTSCVPRTRSYRRLEISPCSYDSS